MNSNVVVAQKPWYFSKTLWFNLISAGLIALEAQSDLLQPYLPGSVYAWINGMDAHFLKRHQSAKVVVA